MPACRSVAPQEVSAQALRADRRRINEMYRMSQPRYRPPGGYWLIFRLDEGAWPVQGTNTLEIELLENDAGVLDEPGVRDVELETKYLMGAAFHRGQDSDLGPVDTDDKARL